MNRLDRLQAILIHLQSKKIVTAQELSDRFSISIRTVYRDIRSLEEAGVPIGAEAGIGYFLTDNYHLPPVMFTNEEASALLFGSKFTEQLSDKPIKTAFESALFKIKAVLKNKEKEHLEILHNHINIFGNIPALPENLYLHDIQNAIVHNRKLQISYRAASAETDSCRLVIPLSLCFYGMRWHLIAFCELRNDYRDFRLDRIKNLRVTDEVFDRAKYKNLEEYMDTIFMKEDAIKIVLETSKEASDKIKEYKYMYGYTHQIEKGEVVEMHFINNELDGFARWIIHGGNKVNILEPVLLKEKINKMVKDLAEWYLK